MDLRIAALLSSRGSVTGTCLSQKPKTHSKSLFQNYLQLQPVAQSAPPSPPTGSSGSSWVDVLITAAGALRRALLPET